jgi:hypothetical protein
MTRSKLLPTFAALAVAATALIPVGAASAAPTTVPSLDIVGAYAYKDTKTQPGKTYATVVFKTKGELPRRYDGMIRAAGFLDGTGHSIGSVRGAHGKSAHCYTFMVAIKDGKIAGPDGKSAKLGTKHTVKVTVRGDNGDLSDTASVTLRKARTGDASGKPLGC